MTWPSCTWRLAEWDELELAGLADELADGLGVGHARQFDDDPIGPLDDDDRPRTRRSRSRGARRCPSARPCPRASATGRRPASPGIRRGVRPARSSPSLVSISRDPDGLLESGTVRLGAKQTMRARTPMTAMRIGPALRIEAGCYTEPPRTAVGRSGPEPRRRPTTVRPRASP